MRGSRKRVGLLAAVLLATCIAGAEMQAQQVVVRGTVHAAGTAEPVSSATVVVKGTSIGTATNDSGAFLLQVPNANVTLVVSRLGYARIEVPLNGRTTVAVQLTHAAVSLNEVVVVGYGTQKRSDITGSVTSVPMDRLEEKPNTNVVQGLQGSMPGVTVTTGGAGAEPSLDIQVRGRNSISASTAPLIVVDGIPYNGVLSELNPNDIQSIDVLKDASATAIYGTRGSNGVILVTSRKGVSGKPSIRYTGYVGTQSVANEPQLMNAQQFYDFKCARLRTSPTQTCDSLLTPTELANYQAGVNTDWIGIGTHTGSQVNHDLSFSGGNEDTRYFVGGSILNVNGVALNDEFNRATVRVNLDQKLRSWLSVGTSTQGAQVKRNGVPVNWTTAFQGNPLVTPFDSAGNQLLIPWPDDPTTSNPLENLNARNEDLSKRVFSSNYVQVSVPQVEGLTYRLNAGFDMSDRDAGTYYGRNTQTGLAVGGRSSVIALRSNDWTLENVVRYAHTVGRSTFDLTGLLSEASTSFNGDTTLAQGYPNDVLGYLSNLPLLTVPTYVVQESKLISQMARLNYSFDERYLATVTARRDGFSGFGANNKYGVFPSLALGWNVSNESFFPWKQSVDALKLRFSYGKNGNQAIQPYQTFAQLDDRSYLNGSVSVPGYIPSSLGNPDLKWETTLSKNVGVDLSMWGDRLRVTADAYSSQTSDLLLKRAISSVQGITSVLQNIGKTSNKGVELQVSTLNVDRGGWQWRTDFNISANRNKIVDLYGNQTDDIANQWFIGQPIYVNYGYKFDGIFQNAAEIAASAQPTAQPGYVKVADVNGDGKIDPLDRTFIGSREPSYTAGLTNSVKYRNITLSAYFNSVQGVMRENTLLSTNQTLTDVRRNMLNVVWWTPENGINSYPANSNTSNPFGVAFYQDASFIRLKDLTLSYDVPTSLTSRFGGESLRVYVNGRNLWTKTAWTGLDPELLGLNNLTAQRSVPLERVITTGFTVRF